MNKYLYPCFDKWFEKGGAVYFYSDPHFDDPDSVLMGRTISSQTQIDNINRIVHKNDTLVILGDINNVEWVKKIKAGRKVLILGNHDKGVINYQRKVHKVYFPNNLIPKSEEDKKYNELLSKGYKPKTELLNTGSRVFYLEQDNKLFDEVYEGPLLINHKIILSHEPINFPYAFNIHGHCHSDNLLWETILKKYDCDVESKKYNDIQLEIIKENGWNHLNICAEHTGYLPIQLNKIINSGVLKGIVSIHRETIDNATKKAIKVR
jgi:calcineurin-like phosphoesterase family protein